MKKNIYAFILISIFISDIIYSQITPNSVEFKNGYIIVNEYNSCPITWKTNIIAADAGNITDSIKFGMSPDATDLLDTCLGESLIPPPPPTGVFDQRFILPNNDAVKIDFRNDTVVMRNWRMNFQPSSSGYPMTFSWNYCDFPANGSFFLKDASGILINVNMRNQSSYVLTNSAVNSLFIEYVNNTTKKISVNSGWNMISIPLNLNDMNPSSIFPDAETPALYYENEYLNTGKLEVSKGYWVKFKNPGDNFVSGNSANPKNINVKNGWNIIGPFEENIPVSEIVTFPNGILTSDFFGYNNGYFSEDTLVPGKGYWIKTTSAGVIMKDNNDNFSPNLFTENDNNLEDQFRIEFTDFDQSVSNLYLLNENKPTSEYDLPPVPPAGIFDVRFSSDKLAESFGKSNLIKINSAERPLKIKIYNLQNKKIRIKDNIDGSILNKLLSENEEIIISSPLDNLVLIDESSIPDSYAVGQNYPNPFNPSTVIKYQIPKDGHVRIIIYDILGKEVHKLIDKYQQTGRYEVNFKAADLSSGVYFYKFESGNFNDLRKMMLLK